MPRRARRELAGKSLGCWCVDWEPGQAFGRPCHAEVLARLANGEDLLAISKSVLERLGPPSQLGLFA